MHNILTCRLIRIDKSKAPRVEASLPEIYVALMADKVISFPSLRPHQRHAWHAFLVQLGAMAMHRAGLTELPVGPEEWATLIRGLTADYNDDEPWQLVVKDITKPAFMQPPARSKERAQEYTSIVDTPDELDMLVTSKNHDLKSAVAVQANVDDWIFALISLQTMEGFGGAGNYGISRMNGGLGNRPAFALAPADGGLGAHVKRDILALLERRRGLDTDAPRVDNPTTLLWTMPWDGTTNEALPLDCLDPFYVEVCRRVRLYDADGLLRGIRTSSKAARIRGQELKGRTGDPWTPTNQEREGLPLTLSAGGFTYKRITEYLLSGAWERPTLLRPTESEQHSAEPMRLVARAMVRGQGKTEGYHERSIPVRHKVVSAMLRRDATQELGQIADSRIGDVGKIQRILSHAIQVFLARGDGDKVSPEHRNLARPWLNRLDQIVDGRFFEDLQMEFDADGNERPSIRNEWLRNGDDGVIDHAHNLLNEAMDSLPCPAIHRYKARANAEGLFEGRLRGNSGLPDAFSSTNREIDQ